VTTLRDDLRALEKRDKLEKLLAPGLTPELPWHDMVWLLQVPAWIGLVLWIVGMANRATESQSAPPPEEIGWLLVLGLVVLALRFLGPLLRSRRQRLRDRVRRQGELVPAAMVMVNDAWFRDDNDRWLPGVVVLSFDPAVRGAPAKLKAVAARLFALKGVDRRTLPPAHADLAWSLYHEMGPLRSRPVPPELCDGLARCWMVCALLPPRPLWDGELLQALALEGEPSPEAVAVLPAAVAPA
jgi:hypothetical protein